MSFNSYNFNYIEDFVKKPIRPNISILKMRISKKSHRLLPKCNGDFLIFPYIWKDSLHRNFVILQSISFLLHRGLKDRYQCKNVFKQWQRVKTGNQNRLSCQYCTDYLTRRVFVLKWLLKSNMTISRPIQVKISDPTHFSNFDISQTKHFTKVLKENFAAAWLETIFFCKKIQSICFIKLRRFGKLFWIFRGNLKLLFQAHFFLLNNQSDWYPGAHFWYLGVFPFILINYLYNIWRITRNHCY